MNPEPDTDGAVPSEQRSRDILAIGDLAISYGHAVDDRDWARWEALFTPDALIDYTSAGGIAGTPSELAAWFPDAFAAFEWCMHSMSTHEIRFDGHDTATGRVHVFNRNGVRVDGDPEVLDVGAVYEDTYRRVDDRWLFSGRHEHVRYIEGGRFAEMLRSTMT
ncbi:MAG: nuclear transport factor 2 family protein [Microthrixaceae bacterium]